jgi:hypothetical protein
MNAILRTTTFAAAVALGLVAAAPARADHDHDYERIDSLARRIQNESSQLYGELSRAGYDPELRMARNEVAQIYHLARRMHDTAHHGGSSRQLDRDVHALKRLVHHVEEHLVGYRHYRNHVDRLDRLTHQLEDRVDDLDGRRYSRDYSGGWYSYSVPGGFSIRFGR